MNQWINFKCENCGKHFDKKVSEIESDVDARICPTCKRELEAHFNDIFYGNEFGCEGMKLRKVTNYLHHGNKVFVREDLKGKHRQYCLCYHCKHYSTDRKKNCLISNAIHANCVRYGLVTPVFECPEFEQIGDIYTP